MCACTKLLLLLLLSPTIHHGTNAQKSEASVAVAALRVLSDPAATDEELKSSFTLLRAALLGQQGTDALQRVDPSQMRSQLEGVGLEIFL